MAVGAVRPAIRHRKTAGSGTATETVVRSAPDGHTLLVVAPANAINATLYDKLNFNFIRDIAPVASIARTSNVVVVSRTVNISSLAVTRNPNEALALRSFRAGEASPPVWYQSHRSRRRSPFLHLHSSHSRSAQSLEYAW